LPGYADGFLLAVPKGKLPAYKAMARKASRIWKDHGALQYRECAGDDLEVKGTAPFPPAVKARKGETVVLAWILYRSRAHRDRVNKSVMEDPRIAAMCGMKDLPFDVKRMLYGGFRVIVEA
jgi:uncharacterized protein YbaA (DUF1428 family)